MIHIGTSGFSFQDWKGPVYPLHLPDREMLRYYERTLGFDSLEVNFTYYRPPSARTMEGMVKKTSENFNFVVRSHADMTHNIWEDETRARIKDTSAIFKEFRTGLEPMVKAGRLGCVLLQFPSFFWPRRENADYILTCKERLADVPLVIEFRNKAWVRDDTFEFLRRNGLGFCVVDEPQLPRLMPFVAELTSDIAYVRLHGRNANWFTAPREERYNYLYSDAELKAFVPSVRVLSDGGRSCYIFFNNCHAGQAARNALMMKRLLGIIQGYSTEQARVANETPAEGSERGSEGELFSDR
jgi:uncharacterized protein YecE (DUF72 family)